ncbi:hypothetical protein F5884DRAFT_315037 [Xylogone sp. PMI_703]|nr:hypothetical protein F5884DRAFT_315037 [Xylogone sp. PMI_703]
MSTRRPHKKSHHGCLQCKQRRIKCDEEQPECGFCRKRRKTCSFWTQVRSASSLYHPRSIDTSIIFSDRSKSQPSPADALPLLELELMHHWHASFCLALEHRKEVDDQIKTTISHMALSHPYLMNGLLAVSAFHSMQSCPISKRQLYADTAIRYKLLALSKFTPLLDDITEENCNAVFALSSLMALLAFATRSLGIAEKNISISEAVSMFKLIQGVAAVVAQARGWLNKGELALLLRKPLSRDRCRPINLPSAIRFQLETLLRLCYETPPEGDNDNILSIQSAAIKYLIDIHDVYTGTSDRSTILAWPVLAGTQFMNLLLQGNQLSLVILAHYGVILDWLNRVWWLKGYGRCLISMVENLLDDSWLPEISLTLDITRQTR